ncbi:methylmalonyl-CoA mutase family protein [Larkinella bovis]|uniref:Methylmalonyl-CoA mutase family protein n=1 Tax=Larkinella bovis TaxID=683041 RepID=A0ABW0ID71_9BACT
MTDLDIKSLFPPVTKAQWIQQVQKDLRGQPFDSLKRTRPDGLAMEPFYTSDDLELLPLAEIQQAQDRSPGWLNVPNVRFQSEAITNTVLRDELSKGADGLQLDLLGSRVDDLDWNRLLNGLKLSETPVWFAVSRQSETLVSILKARLPYQLKGGILDELTGHLLTAGTVSEEALNQLVQATRQTLDSPRFRTLTVDSSLFHNAGATATQELAFTLNAVVELYDFLTENGLSVEQIVPKTALSVAVGTSYFTEIAKLRAFRILWQRLISQYDSSFIHPLSPVFLHAQTSTFYDAAVTPDTNLLRATTEAMAAVIGGCDALTVHPYDAVFGEPDEFSRRIARNVSILLKEEAHLDKTLDPAAGSYYLETLTAQLVKTAWSLFLAVENRGGLRRAFTDGFVPEEIEKAYQATVEAVKTGRILVGVTKFRTSDEALPKPAKPAEPSPAPLPERRLAEEFE